MKNGCHDLTEAKVADRNEKAKKLYRYITDVARRVNEGTVACRTIPDLFSTNIEVQRQKLRDNCEKLLFLDPLNYGKKSLELLWRKVYYDTVCAAKKLRESDNENDSYLYTHIICGIGHFHHFITRIQSDLKVIYKTMDYTVLAQDEDSEDADQTTDEDVLQFGRSALHSCLIYLGDLSRYQVEIFQSLDPSVAARYYLQAAHIDLSLGMPYNQLGNLYMDKNYNLDSVCYYIQCLSCESPFEGAMGNLTKIFEKNSQFNETIQNSEFSTQSEHIQSTVANFLSLIEIWYVGKNGTNIPERCNTIAHQLKMAMDFVKSPLPDINKNYVEFNQAIEEENINPTYLNGNLVHKMVQICLFTMAKMMETDEVKAFACKAFTLALLSQLLQKLLKQIESLGLKNPAKKYKVRPINNQISDLEAIDKTVEKPEEQIKIENDVTTNGNTGSGGELNFKEVESDAHTERLQNGDGKNNKKTSKRRRRRRLASSESSDMSNVDTESSEIESDGSCTEDEISDSTYQSEDDSKSEGSNFDVSDIEEEIVKLNEDDKPESINQSEETNGDVHVTNSVAVNTDTHINDTKLNELEIQNFLLGNNFLPSIKLLQDWILTEKDLILSCGDSGEALFQSVVDLLNILSYYFLPKSNANTDHKQIKVLNYVKHLARNLKLEYKTIPLPEDVNLRGTSICKYDKYAAEWQILDRYKTTLYEENTIRILNFIDFGNNIAKIVPRIRYNRSMKIFYFKKLNPPKISTKLNHKRSREWHNSKKHHESGVPGVPGGSGGPGGSGSLPRRLGALWLAARVRELERADTRAAAHAAPALLALDTRALHLHLRHVNQLLRARTFILLVPTVVVQELDALKRSQSSARDAIRWLEATLRGGSRFVRAQRPGQARPLPLLKYPRKAPPHVHNFIQILEFCNHFIGDEKQNQGGNGDPDGSMSGKAAPMLVLLVGDDPAEADEQYKEFSLTGAARAAGISVENIGDFYAKWRQTVPKNGKKR